MARGPCTFKQRDATRATRAVLKAGLNVQRVEFDRDGKIVVVAVTPLAEGRGENEWDNVS